MRLFNSDDMNEPVMVDIEGEDTCMECPLCHVARSMNDPVSQTPPCRWGEYDEDDAEADGSLKQEAMRTARGHKDVYCKGAHWMFFLRILAGPYSIKTFSV